MSVLHYTIGLPPKRRGGSVQYAYDLIREQAKNNNVFVLTCGDTLFRPKKVKFSRRKKQGQINTFKLKNPVTPTLIYGTENPNSQFISRAIDYENIKLFIKKNNITLFHIHTFQGLHKDIVLFIKQLGVKIIYTTHDFHGLCPHYNFINEQKNLCSNPNANNCARCNQNEPSEKFLRVANSTLYQFLKKFPFINYYNRKKTNKKIYKINKYTDNSKISSYETLLNYYKEYFNLIDCFHFNSEQTRTVFEKYLGSLNGYVEPVVTKVIEDKRKELILKDKITFGYIGNTKEYKGFPILKSVLSEIYNEGFENFCLKVYGSSDIGFDKENEFIEYCPPYSHNNISSVILKLDCIIVPSKWYETFSLVTLESLAYGRPVIVSDHVGAKDIIQKINEKLIFSSRNELKNLIKNILINPELLKQFNRQILSTPWEYSMEIHARRIQTMYDNLVKNNEF